MLTLGVETATEAVGVALGDGAELLAVTEIRRPRRHAELLVPMIEDLCRHSGCRLDEIGLVAVDAGPGLFTGLRVGIATATALARALGTSVVALTSLEILAHGWTRLDREIVAVLDARKNEVYHARFAPTATGLVPRREMAVGGVTELLGELAEVDADLVVVGAGAWRYREEFEARGHEVLDEDAARHPSVATLVRLAADVGHRARALTPDAVRPHYLRAPDAEISWATRQGVT